MGVIYILTNPSFSEYVKIGYADDVKTRLNQLNRSECIPFAFRLYAYYDVPNRLTDMKLHSLIDKLNPELRAVETFDGKRRQREFYLMSAEDAYSILQSIAEINGLEANLHKVEQTAVEKADEKMAEENRVLAANRHHFKEIEFTCSLTGHKYKTGSNKEGTLYMYDLTVDKEVPNNSKPSRSEIAKTALQDLTGIEEKLTLYQYIHKIEKLILNK